MSSRDIRGRQSPYKELARERKASTMAAYIFAQLGPETRRSALLPDLVAAMEPEQRLDVAKASGVHAASRPDDEPPSAETWSKVVSRISELVGLSREHRVA